MMRAVRKHVKDKWIILYIERWLKAPAQDAEGKRTKRERGTPQGGVITPLLANIFLHYAFDLWIAEDPGSPAVRALCGRHHRPLQRQSGKRTGTGRGRKYRYNYASVDWNCTRKRRSSSTAKTRIGKSGTRTKSSTFWGLRFGLGTRSLAKVCTLSAASVRPSRRMRREKDRRRDPQLETAPAERRSPSLELAKEINPEASWVVPLLRPL